MVDLNANTYRAFSFQKCAYNEMSTACFLHKVNETNELFLGIILDVHISLVKLKIKLQFKNFK